jgi:sugar/nucleoside kinase (ribokinase family)
MSLLVVGSVAYDSVKTHAGSRDGALGGSATYFSIASSYFAPVSLVAVVGEDFRPEHLELLKSHRVDTSGLEHRPGKTFRWAGVYGAEDVNIRDTLDTQLNVFADFSPELSPAHRSQPYLFLANIDPVLQMDVLGQMSESPSLVALDTMNYWIEGKSSALSRVIESTDVVFMDEGEARSFAAEVNLVRAAKRILSLGPSALVVKRGEHGVLLFNQGSMFAAPAFPLENVVDPTGAGDSFAGGFMGYLAATGDLSDNGFRRAAILGSVMGSFTVESFSADRLGSLTRHDVEERFRALTDLSRFGPLTEEESLPWRDNF